MDVVIIGAGIGGLTLGLALQRAGMQCRIYEAAPDIKPIGVGINVLPHGAKELSELGLEAQLAKVAISTSDSCFFNRFGQLIYREPAGRAAGYDWPQFSIHRGDLQQVLLDAFRQRLGADRLYAGWQCTGFTQTSAEVTTHFRDGKTGAALASQTAQLVIACDGLHSAIRRQLHPGEGEPVYSGVNMWRGVSAWPPFLTGASMVRAGWLATGKMVIYPIRNNVDREGRQLVNWVAEIVTPKHQRRDWNRRGALA